MLKVLLVGRAWWALFPMQSSTLCTSAPLTRHATAVWRPPATWVAQRSLVLSRQQRGGNRQRHSLRTLATASRVPDDELPFSVYTPEANAAHWQQRPVAVATRTLQIAAALGSWLMEGRVTNRGASQQQLTDVRADRLRQTLTDLGPAFVKIGQAVSSR